MDKDQTSLRARSTALLFSGLIDLIIGAALLLAWTGFLPLDLEKLGIPGWVAAGVGGLLFLSGIAVVTYQLTMPRRPE